MTTVSDWLQQAASEAHALSGWEAVAVLLAIAYLLLAMRRSLWCWPAAAASTLIYTVLFWKVALLMESVLNVYYLAMAAYGYWQWRFGGQRGDGLPLVRWSASTHLAVILATGMVALGVGYLMDNHTHADMAYLDAMTTCFAVVTTVMVARKVVENWLYWVVIDFASIYLYLAKGFYLTAALFVFYVGMATVAYFQWRSQYQRESTPDLGLQGA
ncbi:nicotinamide mononucleotide transporter PnuC [Ferrimonas balearica DSM 9799]|uniref:Nicotinamide riboside transporter PnuC n=1 Tax=Ferrimonas balearica (strain DSM 9799 / CCM 4581 / KCTC 23876 / PAT) TaxID=550540 RepID=E1SQ07_FERBD|nr:nicotinamide riboside transporter PnuC [Ferrimonas balearica]ADN75802.1 nicotinamide mononucleotide transporter PnuC [Ferrimonas balearica DSM 9799]